MVAFKGCSAKGRFTDVAYYLALQWQNEGAAIKEIVKRLNSCRATVEYWLRKGQPPSATTRPPNKATTKRVSARRSAVERLLGTTEKLVGVRFTPKRRIRRERVVVVKKFGSAARIARELTRETGVTVSKTTILRDLRRERKAYVARRGPCLTDAHKADRVVFARIVLYRTPRVDVLLFVFTDEKWFDSNDGRRWHWLKPHEKVPTQQYDRATPKVMVWAAIGMNGFRRIVRVPSSDRGTGSIKINADEYEKLIKPAVQDMRRLKLIMQQDNAPGHTGAINSGFFTKQRVKTLGGWPANSPDLNPIETLWSILAARVTERGPFGEDQLWEFVRDEFDKLSDELVDSLCESVIRRLQACVRLKGALVTSRELAREKKDAKKPAKR
jgi:transposase